MGDILMLIGILGLLLWMLIWGPMASLWRSSASTRVPGDVEARRRYRTRLRYRNRSGYPGDGVDTVERIDTVEGEYPTLPIEERDERYR